jgi:hypothetical protein
MEYFLLWVKHFENEQTSFFIMGLSFAKFVSCSGAREMLYKAYLSENML